MKYVYNLFHYHFDYALSWRSAIKIELVTRCTPDAHECAAVLWLLPRFRCHLVKRQYRGENVMHFVKSYSRYCAFYEEIHH